MSKSFFSFGLNGSYICRSAEGLRYHNLPPTLHDIVLFKNVETVYWAALGPLTESWFLSYKDREGRNRLTWGADIPWELEECLKEVVPSPNIYAFLGPRDSFIAWSPKFIRWAGVPSGVEACLQSWLTPSGWKAGPPRMVVWSRRGAYFALSEYGEVEYRTGTGDMWPIFRETIEEWESEAGFSWSALAYITLDPTTIDQFVAVREDRIWAGSNEDDSEDALESFALNFFAAAKQKTKARPHPSSNPRNPETVPETHPPSKVSKSHYEKWAADVASAFAAAVAANGGNARVPKKLEIRNQNPKAPVPTKTNGEIRAKLLSEFPHLPPEAVICKLSDCIAVKAGSSGIRACKHDVEGLLRASGKYSLEFLKQERIRWHPDRFGRMCSEEWRETGRRLAEEMFKIVDSLITELKGAGTTNGGV
ncbi:hypothetical protein M011DRAFT_471405 [Sporormia fimetaria CBS 119925]|uniref:Uncharacterized protein n=1 Tax=Sporormia fimetaria CBS 119925 TaxID=1340428 RepID=A0A6A6UYX6_9PLEO|nr:hypothetical protein M011DRAFT_471405 [Sporormia fimetaria CBS 119925]